MCDWIGCFYLKIASFKKGLKFNALCPTENYRARATQREKAFSRLVRLIEGNLITIQTEIKFSALRSSPDGNFMLLLKKNQ